MFDKPISRRRNNKPEEILQTMLAAWLTQRGILFNASCAGMLTHPKVMAKMKRAGAKNGFPDIQILEPNSEYHGLFIEVKSETGKTSNSQKEWKRCLIEKGYCSVIMPKGLSITDGLEWCKCVVEEYMNIK